MTFKGFNLVYPEYDVVTPQTGLSFTVRSMNVQEEERLKGSLINPNRITEHLNKCIFDLIVKKPASIKDYQTFLKAITLKDRDALLYGIYHITYEEIRNYDIVCSSPQCGKTYAVTINASDTFNIKQYPEKNILGKKIKVDLPISKGVSAFIRQPTLFDEQKNIKDLSSRPGSTIEIISETLIIDRFEQEVEDSKENIIYDERVDIIDAYLSLKPRDKKIIDKKYDDEFGQYAIELKMKSFCNHCGFEEIVDIDIASNFFRALYAR